MASLRRPHLYESMNFARSAPITGDSAASDISSTCEDNSGKGKASKAIVRASSSKPSTTLDSYRDYSHVSPDNETTFGLVSVKRTLPEKEGAKLDQFIVAS